MTIKIFVFDYLTHETIIDNAIEVNGDYEIAKANHRAFREIYPNCQVNFVIDSENFLMSPPLNQEKDEAELSYEAYMDKWYPQALESDSDMPDDEIERQIDSLIEEDWNKRDSICH
jgi:hypothetical protein